MNENGLFATSWLELREPLDHRSRAGDLLPPLRAWWRERIEGAGSGGRIVDVGCGTGANLRYLGPLLPGPQQWTLVDHDADLLARVQGPGGLVSVETHRRDLTGDLSELLGTADLVTASAFLDLVSRHWLEDVVEGCRRSGAAAYFALTYDGDFCWYADESLRTAPDGPNDEAIRDAVNTHQRRDKGFGSALGPEAAPEAARLFGQPGSPGSEGPEYRVWIRPSPWILGPGESPVARELLDGWAAAAREARPGLEDEVRRWADNRRALLEEEAFGLTVSHLDVLALPSDSVGTASDPSSTSFSGPSSASSSGPSSSGSSDLSSSDPSDPPGASAPGSSNGPADGS